LGKVFSNKDNFGHLGEKKISRQFPGTKYSKKKKTLEKKIWEKMDKIDILFFFCCPRTSA